MASQIAAVSLPLPLFPHFNFAYRADDIDSSTGSDTTAFLTGITTRDVFGGVHRCIICGRGNRTTLENCHLIPEVETNTWADLKVKHYLPNGVKTVEHESRNGVTFCAIHHKLFDNYQAFIRYVRECDRYIYVNYSGDPDEDQFHGKAVGLNGTDARAPFPTAFLIHEIRTRGFHPFQPTDVPIAAPPLWQDWLSTGQLIDTNGNILRSTPRRSVGGDPTGDSFHQGVGVGVGFETAGASNTDEAATAANSNFLTLSLTTADIEGIVEATHNMPSWKACEIEGLSWGGTAAQNIAKYGKQVGFEPSTPSTAV